MIYTQADLKTAISEIRQDLENTLFKTLGPGGKNILLARNQEETQFTKDGISILNALRYDNPVKQAILNVIRESSQKTFEESGDGTTSTAVLALTFFEKTIT